MKDIWSIEELQDHFRLTADEMIWLSGQEPHNQLGSAVFLKIFQYQGRFPSHKRQVSPDIVTFIAQQLTTDVNSFETYDWAGRSSSRTRRAIYEKLGIRDTTTEDAKGLSLWLSEQPILYEDQSVETLIDFLYQACHDRKFNPPTRKRMKRIVSSAITRHEQTFFDQTASKLSASSQLALDNLLYVDDTLPTDYEEGTVIGWLKGDAGQASLTMLKETANRLQRLQAIDLPANLFANTATRVVEEYVRRAASEPPRELRRHSRATRFTLVAAFCWVRQRQITDQLVDLFIRIVHKINGRAEQRVEKRLMVAFRTEAINKDVVVRLLQAAIDNPEGQIQDVLYPIASPQQMKALVVQYRTTSQRQYEHQVYSSLRASYGHHYRQMLPILLDVLKFRSSTQTRLINAIDLLKRYVDSKSYTYPSNEDIPIEGIIPSAWHPHVVEIIMDGQIRINRINYEICVLTTLRDHLLRRTVWVDGARDYRNLDEDMPQDYEQNRIYYYQALDLPLDSTIFV